MKALVVDDNESLRKLFQIFLQGMGFDTDGAPNGNIAFKMIKSSDYDLILSDMDMPVVNGMELYKLINMYSPQLTSRMVFATGNEFDEGYRTFFNKISCPVLSKPVMLDDLKEIVRPIKEKVIKNKPHRSKTYN